ncbi:uncharacterized protein LOC119601986 [Lucilia sericata]|uniref:uncharacterized protein LOC119601986 n=1 Tax=Lucilia sericata TaxID=13632 RepID=UPI0018A86DB1|nr:uncharacterized protein LOC119601986 [Lucilia sericata]
MRLVLGDFNAHHQLWHSSLGEDQRGALQVEQIDESIFCILNDDASTRIMGTSASSPDITIASAGLINYATWRAVVFLGSDHLPIIVCLDRPNDFIVSERRQYVNQKKADWHGFREFTERIFSDLNFPSNVHHSERKFRETVISAAARFIPAGRISVVRPHFPAEAARLADERDDIRNTNPGDPRLTQLNIEISRLVNEDKRKRWLDHLKNCNLSSGVSKLWSTVRSLSLTRRRRMTGSLLSLQISPFPLTRRRRMTGSLLSLQISPFPTLKGARAHFAGNSLSTLRETRRNEVFFANFTTFQSRTYHNPSPQLKLQTSSTTPNHLRRLAPTEYPC